MTKRTVGTGLCGSFAPLTTCSITVGRDQMQCVVLGRSCICRPHRTSAGGLKLRPKPSFEQPISHTFFHMACRGQLCWFQKEFWLYVSLCKNDPTSHLFYNLVPLSVFSFKTSSIQHDVQFVHFGPILCEKDNKAGSLEGVAYLWLTNPNWCMPSGSHSDPIRTSCPAPLSWLTRNNKCSALPRSTWHLPNVVQMNVAADLKTSLQSELDSSPNN